MKKELTLLEILELAIHNCDVMFDEFSSDYRKEKRCLKRMKQLAEEGKLKLVQND